MTDHDLALPAIDEFVRLLGDPDVTAAGARARGSAGAVAALTAALAADLVAQVALGSPGWSERGGALAQADVIRERCGALALRVQARWEVALGALERALTAPAGDEPDRRSGDDEPLGRALSDIVDLLLGVGEAASDAAGLAELAARSSAALLSATALSATILAASASEVAAHLLEVNLLVSPEDDRSRRARELVAAATASREAALALTR